jgi:hypothetical protein
MSLRNMFWSPLFYVPVILFFMGWIVFYGPSQDRVRAYLEESGYRQVVVQGPVGGCGKAYSKYTFIALSPNGGRISCMRWIVWGFLFRHPRLKAPGAGH